MPQDRYALLVDADVALLALAMGPSHASARTASGAGDVRRKNCHLSASTSEPTASATKERSAAVRLS